MINLIKGIQMNNQSIEWYLSQSEKDMQELSKWTPKNLDDKLAVKEKWGQLISQSRNTYDKL